MERWSDKVVDKRGEGVIERREPPVRGDSGFTDATFSRALIEGMREADRIGVNPYAFGLIGATVLILIVLPVIYSVLVRTGEADREFRFWNVLGRRFF